MRNAENPWNFAVGAENSAARFRTSSAHVRVVTYTVPVGHGTWGEGGVRNEPWVTCVTVATETVSHRS